MRELKCKVGDLAIVTRLPVAERIGLLVRIVESSPELEYCWLVEFQGSGVLGRDIRSKRVMPCRFGLFHDWNLTPIRSDELINEEEKREEIHE
ncbi:TPA: hypothetical protein QDC55_003289 [Burkholderia cenocepacia]|nr:hypothetical protein [Burkholderia cenocepacia]HDR9810209.1 hypothetical protein [Burkholderia cenocepacia]HDR9817979.1 hypothetical protein [Burkholderia cenocepacia]HDR9829724.1 hypothetical protein [Burkholderia cenocepacia]